MKGKTLIDAIKIMLPGGDDSADDEDLTPKEMQKKFEEEDKLSSPNVEEEREWNGRTESKKKTADGESALPKIDEHHRNLISPQLITPEPTKLQFGDRHVRTIFINKWNEHPQVGFLKEVFTETNVVNDISLHISPYRSEEAEKELQEQVESARQVVNGDSGSQFTRREKQKEQEQTIQLYESFKDSDAVLFDVSMYITIRGDSEKELEEATDEIMKALKSNPAFCHPEIPKKNQLNAFKSVNPVLNDELGYSNKMLGAGIATMYPFSTTSFIEKNGVDMGIHSGNDSPVIVNRFEGRDTGYNQLTFGKIGSGKSFATKLEILRTYASRSDTKIIMLDPLEGFTSVNLALGGQHIEVGGKLGLNPMEIHYIPPEKRTEQADPYGITKSKVLGFFERYYNARGSALSEIKNGRGVLERAIDKAYKRKGIKPNDLESHKNESPTVLDVKEVLEEISEDPKQAIDMEGTAYTKKFEDAAADLLISFSQFEEGGEYRNLAMKNEVNIKENDVNYIDLKQREASSKTGLMMHLLLHEVYEEAQRTDKKLLFAIDEAHMLLDNAESLDYLEHVVRHSRHYDMSINFITQNIQDFFQNDQTKGIAQLCSILRMHRTESGMHEGSELAKTLELGPKELNFIRTATPGGSHGFSEALIGISEEGFIPAYVIASQAEKEVIDFDVQATKNELEDELERMAQTVDSSEGTTSDIGQ